MIPVFKIGEEWWSVKFVPPSSPLLIDRTGTRTVATTDAITRSISISNELAGDMLHRVMTHEVAHAAMEAFGINERIRKSVVPWKRVEVEEMICNLVAEHGETMLQTADELIYQLTR